MKTTTTIYEIVQSELWKIGLNEFQSCNTIDYVDGELNFMNRIAIFDPFVKEVVTRVFFRGLSLKNGSFDEEFKRLWVNHFLHREIGFQTLEMFRAQVISTFLKLQGSLNSFYENMTDYAQGKNNSTTQGTHDNRTANVTLPQDEVNINVDNTLLNYADSNSISRDKNNSNTNSVKFDAETLAQFNTILEGYLSIFDRNCFLQVW